MNDEDLVGLIIFFPLILIDEGSNHTGKAQVWPDVYFALVFHWNPFWWEDALKVTRKGGGVHRSCKLLFGNNTPCEISEYIDTTSSPPDHKTVFLTRMHCDTHSKLMSTSQNQWPIVINVWILCSYTLEMCNSRGHQQRSETHDSYATAVQTRRRVKPTMDPLSLTWGQRVYGGKAAGWYRSDVIGHLKTHLGCSLLQAAKCFRLDKDSDLWSELCVARRPNSFYFNSSKLCNDEVKTGQRCCITTWRRGYSQGWDGVCVYDGF